jgi:hypothetical protein
MLPARAPTLISESIQADSSAWQGCCHSVLGSGGFLSFFALVAALLGRLFLLAEFALPFLGLSFSLILSVVLQDHQGG